MKKWMTVLVIIIVVGASTGGIIAANRLYFKPMYSDSLPETPTAESGDQVTAHYMGWLRDHRLYDKYMFNLSSENDQYLQNGEIDSALRQSINQKGGEDHRVSSEAKLVQKDTDTWVIKNKDGQQEYKIVAMENELKVYYLEKRVFDASRSAISGKTTLTFRERERGNPYNFTVGQGVIEGWSENVESMKEGETKIFTIPPRKAYGQASEDLIFEVDKRESITLYEDMDRSDFVNTYEVEPSANMIVQDKFWGWNQTVTSVEGDKVHLRNQPDLGEEYNAYNKPKSGKVWSSEVISIDSNANQGEGKIVIENHPKKGALVDASHLTRHDERFGNVSSIKSNLGQGSSTVGIVVETDDGIVIDFNEEVAGKHLTFKIEVLNINKKE